MQHGLLKLDDSHIHLSGDDAIEVGGGEVFWDQLMSNTFTDPKVQAVAEGGWLITRMTHGGDWPNWEMHPNGDEVLMCTSGRITFVLDEPNGVRRLDLAAGDTFVMPRGTWHTGTGPGPAELIVITSGSGTQHRPA